MTEINRTEAVVPPLRKFFGFRGDESWELAGFVLPVMDLGTLDMAPYHSKIGGVASVFTAAVALQNSHCALQFPAVGVPANARAVVREIEMYTTAAAGVLTPVYIAVVPAVDAGVVLTLQGIAGSWDSLQGAQLTTDRIVPAAQAAGGASATQIITSAARSFLTQVGSNATSSPRQLRPPGPWVVAPGSVLVCMTAGQNVGLNASFFWDEYYLS